MPATLQQATILIIDDFQGMRTMLREFVRSMGVTKIDTASHGKEALTQLSNVKYDIVICDFNLGAGQNGQQVLEEAKLHNYIGVSTVWVMVTAEKTHEMVMGAAEIKPDDYLLKPINQALLENRLVKQIARKQSLGPIEEAIRSQDYAAAIVRCDEQIKAKVLNPQEILRIKSDLLLTMEDFDGACALFQAVLAIRSVPWAKTGMGKVRFHAQDYAGARDLFQQVLHEHPMYIEAADWLAKTYAALGDATQAQQILSEAVKVSPNSPTRQKLLADTAYRNGALAVAQTAFEKIIRINEFSPHKSPTAYTELARVLSDQASPLEALKLLERSKKDFKYNAHAAIQTAAAESTVYQKMGQDDRAQAAMARAESLMAGLPSKVSAEVAVDVAKSLFALGMKDKACALLGEVIQNNHENTELSRQVENIFERQQLGQEGQALIARSRQEVVAINNQGVTLAKTGDFLGGVNLLRAAAQKLPNNEVILVNLCSLLIGLMSRESKKDLLASEVRGLLERVHQLNPANRKSQQLADTLTRVLGRK
jgi:DNA-binding NarL/FixJ family response regulator/Tfp pilus assembly protein PilF